MRNLRPVLCFSLLLVSPAAWGIDRVDLFAPVPRDLAAFGVAALLLLLAGSGLLLLKRRSQPR